MNKYFNITSLCVSAFLLVMSPICMAETQAPHKPMVEMKNHQGKIYGKVIETLRAGNYTYVHVDTGKTKHWAATSPITLKKGSMVAFVPSLPMNNFTSKALNRKFDVVYFVDKLYTDKTSDHPAKADMHGVPGKVSAKPVAGITKASNGNTINEVLKQKEKLAGKTIRVRGKVVKYTQQVMGKNWIHIQDSSTSKDLTITTTSAVKKGDVILVSGKLQLNKNFGYGYTYDVLLEDSTVTVE